MDFFNYGNKVATHPSNEINDISAVNYLSADLSPWAKIIPNFEQVDKWSNHDGNFEYISNLDISRAPKQNFIVQIKSTYIYKDENDKIKYNLIILGMYMNEINNTPNEIAIFKGKLNCILQ